LLSTAYWENGGVRDGDEEELKKRSKKHWKKMSAFKEQTLALKSNEGRDADEDSDSDSGSSQKKLKKSSKKKTKKRNPKASKV
jgi:hypothetical protein